MQPIYRKTFHIPASAVDCFDRLKASHILDYLQEVAGDHSALLGTNREALTQRHLFWAVSRHRVQITRLPRAGENITVETWPMPTTRTAYPRSTVGYDQDGREVFRGISLWVLMDTDRRSMVLPGKSGVCVEGLLRGDELAAPGAMIPKTLEHRESRTVRFTELDWNGHMNNCRYLDWVGDTQSSAFHSTHSVKEFSVCYLSEAQEGETVFLDWELTEDGSLAVDGWRSGEAVSAGHSRVFSVRMLF